MVMWCHSFFAGKSVYGIELLIGLYTLKMIIVRYHTFFQLFISLCTDCMVSIPINHPYN